MAAKSDDSGESKQMMKISELPVYGNPEVNVRVSPEEIGKFREGVSVVRKTVWTWLDTLQVETGTSGIRSYQRLKGDQSWVLHFRKQASKPLDHRPLSGPREKIKDTYETGKAHSQSTLDYIQNDEGVLPRLAVIGVSGLAGIVLGYKGGVVRKAAFSTFAVISATSLCYPKEAVALTSGQYDKLKNKVQELRGKSDSDEKGS